ncbi:MAG: rRNA maturation RNase YbeY [Gemmatimonadota bacterium]
MQLTIQAPGGEPLPEELLHQGIKLLLDSEGVSDGEISITYLADESMLELNQRYLGHDWVPDVLSFPLHEPEEPVMGDVYVGFQQALRQAASERVPVPEELLRLALHGTLHLLGYEHPDHPAERSGSPMYQLQERLVRSVVERA